MCSLVLTDFCQTIGLLHCFVLFVWEKLFMVSIFSFSKQNWIPHVTFTHSGWYCCLYNDLLNRIWCVFLKKTPLFIQKNKSWHLSLQPICSDHFVPLKTLFMSQNHGMGNLERTTWGHLIQYPCSAGSSRVYYSGLSPNSFSPGKETLQSLWVSISSAPSPSQQRRFFSCSGATYCSSSLLPLVLLLGTTEQSLVYHLTPSL